MKSISIVIALLVQSFVPAPIAVSLNNCTFTDVGLRGNNYMLKPSEVVDCCKKVQINSTNFKHHVQYMNDMFANNDGLYYTSVDPMKNLPLNYQKDLGYSVYHGESEGQVDLKSELNKIIAKIDQKGFADASQFWEINKIFQMLKDGHVSPNPGTPLGQLETNLIGSANFVTLFPEKNYEDDWSSTYSSKFNLVDDEIILNISDGIDEEGRKVLSIGDITPHDFLIKLANVSGISNWSKDVGANVNAIINKSFNHDDKAIASFISFISPDVFADEYLIKYDDGEEEMLLTRVEVPITELAKYELYSDMLNRKIMLDASLIEEDINLPGKLFKDVAKAFGRFEEASHCTPNFNRNLETNDENIERQKMDESHNEGNTFRLIGWRYYIYDAYTVLQLNTFDNGAYSYELFQSIVEDWNLMVSKSSSKKLIIDVSNNPGGYVLLNQLMTTLLFPTINTKYLTNYVNTPYNDMMDVHLNVFMPLAKAWKNVTDNQLNEYIKLLDVESLCRLEESYDLFWDLYSKELKLDNYTYEEFFEPLQSFFDDMSGNTLRGLIVETLAIVEKSFNPIAAQGFRLHQLPSEPELVIRGGKEIKQFTNIDLFETLYEAAVPDYVQQHVDSSSSFDEYIILSNGVCGSSCDQFVTTSMQVWRNRDISQSKQPVHVVTYGGLGKPIDPSQWGAGFVVSPKVHYNYGPYLGLNLLWDATGEIEYYNAAGKYGDVMPRIPYYANSWPVMSATEVYSNFMMPTGIPMDYLKKNPDQHVPEMFVPFNHSVYFEASKYFVTTSDAMSSAFKYHNSLPTCMASMAMMVGFFFVL